MKPTPPFPVEILDQLKALGLRVRQARIRRKWRQEDLAARANLSVTAVKAIEQGEPTSGIGTYMRALWAMGLNRELDLVAEPAIDRDGMALQFSLQSKRVGVTRKVNNDF
jgi:transcriptional regulator with XRE-family HTH domain